MRSTLRASMAAVTLIGLVGATRASADPITITSGQVVLYPVGGSFQFNGDGLDVGSNSLRWEGFNGYCSPCSPSGTQLSFSNRVAASSNIYGLGPQVDLYFQGPSFSSSEVTADHLTVGAPFTMTGTVSFFSDEYRGPDWWDALTGSGRATMTFSQSPDHYFTNFRSLTYDFGPAASVTPEPGSLLLLGSGIAACWRYRRRQRVVTLH